MSKTCPQCKVILEVEQFNKNKSAKDGLSRMCKKCISQYNSKYYKDNPDKATLKNIRSKITRNPINRNAYLRHKYHNNEKYKEYCKKSHERSLKKNPNYHQDLYAKNKNSISNSYVHKTILNMLKKSPIKLSTKDISPELFQEAKELLLLKNNLKN